MKNKRGVEQPQVIVYVLFVTVLVLAGMYVAFTKLGGVDITYKFQDYSARLNTVAAKAIFTTECFAYETSYSSSDGKTHYQVEGGTINWAKFTARDQVSASCLSEKNQIFLQLQEINNAFSDKAWTCPAPSKSDCAEPKNRVQWKDSPRSYFVLIHKDTVIHKGILTVRLQR